MYKLIPISVNIISYGVSCWPSFNSRWHYTTPSSLSPSIPASLPMHEWIEGCWGRYKQCDPFPHICDTQCLDWFYILCTYFCFPCYCCSHLLHFFIHSHFHFVKISSLFVSCNLLLFEFLSDMCWVIALSHPYLPANCLLLLNSHSLLFLGLHIYDFCSI